MIKSVKYPLLLGIPALLLFLFFSSCNKSTPTEPKNPAPASSGGGTASLGTISYSPDYSKEKSADLDTAGTNISVTDAGGIKWDLSIPAQGLGAVTKISVIPIKSVVSDSTYNITNGVIFQPDGFQFSSPATLTVTIPTSSKKYAFYLFTQDGKEIDFADAQDNGGVFKIPISHFSGAAAGVPKNFEDLCKIATSRYNADIKEENIITSQDPVVPVPPDIDLKCGTDPSTEKALNDYIAEFMLPEDTVAKSMLGALSAMQLAGCNQDVTAGGLAQVSALGEHLVKKAQAAYDQYSNDNKKFIAVARVMLAATALHQMMGGSDPNILAELGVWAKRYFDEQLNKLKQGHDYSVMNSLFAIAAQAQLLGADYDYYDQIMQAVSFKFDLNEGLIAIINDNGYPADTEQVIISGTVDLKPGFSKSGWNYSGDGYINYKYGLTADACYDASDNPQKGHDKIVLPQSFGLHVEIDSLDLCGWNNIVIKFDSLGAQVENWVYGYDINGAYGCNSVGSDMAHSANATLTLDLNNLIFSSKSYFDDYYNSFDLHPSIHNGSVNAVDTTYSVDQTLQNSLGSINLKGNLAIKLVHSPQ